MTRFAFCFVIICWSNLMDKLLLLPHPGPVPTLVPPQSKLSPKEKSYLGYSSSWKNAFAFVTYRKLTALRFGTHRKLSPQEKSYPRATTTLGKKYRSRRRLPPLRKKIRYSQVLTGRRHPPLGKKLKNYKLEYMEEG